MRTSVFAFALLGGVSAVATATAQEVHQLDPVSVTTTEAVPDGGLVVTEPQPTPKNSVTKAGIDLLGGPAQTSLYQPLDLLPSIIVESPDPYGLSPTRNINIRGKSDFHLTRNVEGLPLSGIVGGADLFDLENVQQVDVYRGGVPANQGFGISNATGTIDQRLLGPQDQFGAFGRQAFGSFDFRKTFARIDTGALPNAGTKAFISGSTTAADKWKGAGDETRDNAMLGLSQEFGDRVKVDFDAVYDKFAGNTYRALTYAQTQNLRNNYQFEYNGALTGVAATDANYYGFNKVQYENSAVLATVDVKLAEGHHLKFKPYYWFDNGVQDSARGSNVQIWEQQNDNYGGVFEYDGRYGSATDVVAGYWLQSMQPPPPPTDQKLYTVTSTGGLAFARWSTLARIDRFTVNSPYAQLSQTLGQTLVSGGLRYMDLGAPKMQYFNTAGLPNVSFDQVWAYNPAALPGGAVVARDYGELLPNIGARHELNDTWSVNASYARKFGRPDWGPQASNYASNSAAFLAHGVSLQTLVDKVKPELSDEIDVGLRYGASGLTVVPTLFFAKNQNRQVKVVDPGLGGLSYYQGSAGTTEYGAELEAAYELDKTWSVFGSGTLVSETYDRDTPTLSGGASLATKGEQIPNAPRVMLKGGLTYRWGDFAASPVVRYIGKRYGDDAGTQPVSGYVVADFTASYELGHDVGLRNLSAALSVFNIFDRRYVSEISANDTDLSAGTSYYVGAPRTVVGSLSIRF